MGEMSDEDFQNLYAWIDEIPLSRPKRNITRDFSDGVMAAEVVKHFIPRLVELHNYTPANSTRQKLENWRTLSRKVFSKLGYNVSNDVLQNIAENKPHFVEYLLVNLKVKIERYLEQQQYDDNHMQPHPITTTLYKQEPNGSYCQQEEYRHHSIAAPLNSTKSSNSFQAADYLAEGEAYHNASSHEQATTRPSQLPVPIGNHKLTSRSHTGAQYNASQTPTLPPIVSHPVKKKGFSAPERSKYKRPSNFWSAKTDNHITSHKIEMAEKDQAIMETHETIQLLQMKIRRLEHLLQIKDLKIAELTKNLPNR